MSRFFKGLIAGIVKHRFKKTKTESNDDLVFQEIEIIKVKINHIISDSFFILLGIISAGFGLKGFLLPNSFIDGGAMGISLLVHETTGISLSYLIVIITRLAAIFTCYACVPGCHAEDISRRMLRIFYSTRLRDINRGQRFVVPDD